ncbi:MAG: hypothetical protein ACPG31_12540 [Planctomycetota bacterium]
MIHAPHFPLSKKDFAHAMTTGHGRIRQHVERYGVRGHEEAIRDAVFHCRVFDTQIEGFRGAWLAPLCQAIGMEQEVFDWVPEDEELIRQRAAIVSHFQGFDRDQLWEAILPYAGRAKHHSGLICVSSGMKANARTALLHFAQLEGEWIQQKDDPWIGDHLLWAYEQSEGERESAWAILREAAVADTKIQSFLHQLEKEERKPKVVSRTKPAVASVDSVRTFILEGPGSPRRFRFWGWRANEIQQQQLQESLPSELEEEQLERWLAICERKGFPIFRAEYLDLAMHPSMAIQESAIICLAHEEAVELRSLGLNKMESGAWSQAIQLLRKNGLAEDADRFIRSAPKLEVDFQAHWLCMRMKGAMEENPAFHDIRIAIYCYEYNPCMHCREGIVELMQEWETLPDWIAEECRFDAEEDVRKLVATGNSS